MMFVVVLIVIFLQRQERRESSVVQGGHLDEPAIVTRVIGETSACQAAIREGILDDQIASNGLNRRANQRRSLILLDLGVGSVLQLARFGVEFVTMEVHSEAVALSMGASLRVWGSPVVVA
jgi:hypothetical protein